jgi:replication factor A1
MSEKEKLLESLISKSGKSKEEIEQLILDKTNELSGLVSEEGAMYIIANELDIKLEENKPKKTADLVKIEEIQEPKMPVSVACKVLKKYDKVTFSSKNGGEGSVQSILVGDETGIIRIVFWNDKTQELEQVNEQDIIIVQNGYTRENVNSQRIEIHYGPYSDLEINPDGVEIEVKPYSGSLEFTEKKINELEEGDKNIKISATIADVEIPRFYFGCPECFKKVFLDEETQQCPEHGEVQAIKIPIVNYIVDDGTTTLSIVAFRDRAEQLAQKDAEFITSLSEDVDKFKAFTKELIGAHVEVGGNVSTNAMTGELQFLVNQVLVLEKKTIDETNESKEKVEESSISEDDIEIEEIDLEDDLI